MDFIECHENEQEAPAIVDAANAAAIVTIIDSPLKKQEENTLMKFEMKLKIETNLVKWLVDYKAGQCQWTWLDENGDWNFIRRSSIQ